MIIHTLCLYSFELRNELKLVIITGFRVNRNRPDCCEINKNVVELLHKKVDGAHELVAKRINYVFLNCILLINFDCMVIL